MDTIGQSHVSLRETELLIAFADLTLFTRTAREMTDTDLARFVQELYERVATPVEAAGGTVVKFMGDAALMFFPREAADAGVLALLEAQGSVDDWMRDRGCPCRLVIKAHAGSAVLGTFGAGKARYLDIIGSEVNQTAVLESHGFALSVAAFRALSPETRKRFKKHTPPVTYIPLDERHR